MRTEIEEHRSVILISIKGLTENVKWNAPNYSFADHDRITMKIQPPKQIQSIFHRGAKKQDQPKNRLIELKSNQLTWKENDRMIISYKNLAEIENGKSELT